jgi:predicted nucleic acid-binding protein
MVKTRYLLDTNVLSESRKGRKADRRVFAWFSQKEDDQLFTSVICLMELHVGIFRALRKDPDFGIMLQEWYNRKLKPAFASRCCPVDLAVAEACAMMQDKRTLPYRDGMIAATAHEHSFTLVTRNTSDFRGLGIPLINPWEPDGHEA